MMYSVERRSPTIPGRLLLRSRRSDAGLTRITLAELCQAIGKGRIPATVDDKQYYTVQTKAVKQYFEQTGQKHSAVAAASR